MTLCVFVYRGHLVFLKQRLSMHLEPGALARLTGQQGPGIVSPPPPTLRLEMHTMLVFYVDAGTLNLSLHAYITSTFTH